MASQPIVGISFPFRKEDGEFPKTDINADVVKSNVLSIFAIELGERVMRPEVGANIRGLIFESFGPLLEARLKRAIRTAIANNEPRARVLSIDITQEDTVVNVDILYSALGFQDTVSIALPST